ncbi:location of vulva defective 1 [Drosophila albomicans]|uniref:Location of vulva defective 1 n=1 Tax=Drosophila albomicans TaxID=7291 RepID=A0A6P8YVX7_DROAB|nr:location of vulva defective 1 [Drosophila albomicans]
MYSILLLIVCLAGAAWANPHPTWGESKLMQAMRSTSELQLNNPSRSVECFQYYSEVFDQLLKKYEAEYAACQNSSTLETAQLNAQYSQVVNSLNVSSINTCYQLIDCATQADNLQILSCYSDVAGDNVRAMYNISSTASENYGDLEQFIQQIQFIENQCTNSSKRRYELDTDQAYISLQQCLMGTDPVPTLAPSTSTSTSLSTANDTPTSTSPSADLSTTTQVISSSTSVVTPRPQTRSTSTIASSSTERDTTTELTTIQPSNSSTQSDTPRTYKTSTQTPIESSTAPSTVSRRTPRPIATTTTSFVTTNSATSTTSNSFSSELKKLLHSLRH